MSKQEPVPAIIVNGILEAGKTHFLNEAIGEETFIDASAHGLIICCEEGAEDFDPAIMRANHISVELLSEDTFNEQTLVALVKKYDPDVVYIEKNAMWQNVELPEWLSVQQVITIIDASTFRVYFNNMRQKFVEMLSRSDLVIMYHCDNEKDTSVFKRNLQLINRNLQFLLFDSNDKTVSLEDDLPYSLEGDMITINDSSYGIWFFEINDNPERYNGKKVSFDANCMLDKRLPKMFFIAGRQCMTCCANDIQDLFLICDNNGAKQIITHGGWYNILGVIRYKVAPNKEVMPYIDVISAKSIRKPENEVIGLQN